MSEFNDLISKFNLPGLLKGKKADIPTSEGFKPVGFIGPVMARYVYRVLTEENLLGDEYKEHGFKCGRVPLPGGSWTNYYFEDPDEGARAMKVAKSQYKRPTMVWHFEANPAQIISFIKEETRDKWKGVITGDIQVTTLRSVKHRHEYHCIALPMAVQAAATFLGYDTPNPFSLAELMNVSDENEANVFTDEFHAQMIGHPDKYDDIFDSVLWTRRAALWADLGEKDPKKYTVSIDPKTDTESNKLATCLAFATLSWEDAIWLRLHTVQSPHMGDVNKEGKHLSLYVIGEIFKGEAQAREVWTKELAEIQERTKGEEASTEASSEPTIPATWLPLGRTMFLSNLHGYINTPPDGMTAAAAKMGMEYADFVKWIEHLKKAA